MSVRLTFLDLIFPFSFSPFIWSFQVSSIIQVVGIIICLHAAAKISHRAQRIASVASKWHAVLTCVSTDAFLLRSSNNVESLETASNPPSVLVNYSESDLESFDFLGMPSNPQYASYMPSYIRRQAFGMNQIIFSLFSFHSFPGWMQRHFSMRHIIYRRWAYHTCFLLAYYIT